MEQGVGGNKCMDRVSAASTVGSRRCRVSSGVQSTVGGERRWSRVLLAAKHRQQLRADKGTVSNDNGWRKITTVGGVLSASVICGWRNAASATTVSGKGRCR